MQLAGIRRISFEVSHNFSKLGTHPGLPVKFLPVVTPSDCLIKIYECDLLKLSVIRPCSIFFFRVFMEDLKTISSIDTRIDKDGVLHFK